MSDGSAGLPSSIPPSGAANRPAVLATYRITPRRGDMKSNTAAYAAVQRRSRTRLPTRTWSSRAPSLGGRVDHQAPDKIGVIDAEVLGDQPPGR